MRSTDRTLDRTPSRPIPIAISLLAALVLALAACTAQTGASAESTASADESTASTEASMEESEEASAEASEDGGQAMQVDLVNFAFDPTEITVSVGDTVRFVNGDTAAHTVTEGTNGSAADDARFDEQVAAGESVEITFDEAGDYDVTCLFHANMNMVVHVE